MGSVYETQTLIGHLNFVLKVAAKTDRCACCPAEDVLASNINL